MFTYEFPTRSGRTYLFFLEANDETPRPFLFNADGQQIGSDEGKYYVLYADTNATVTFVGVGSSPAADFRILEYYLGHETYSEHHVVSLGGRKVEVCGDVDGEVVTVQPPQDGSASVHQLIDRLQRQPNRVLPAGGWVFQRRAPRQQRLRDDASPSVHDVA